MLRSTNIEWSYTGLNLLVKSPQYLHRMKTYLPTEHYCKADQKKQKKILSESQLKFMH